MISLIVACCTLSEATPTCAEDVMITSEFYRRATRTPDQAIELDALHHLAQFLTAEPEFLLHELAAVLVRACDAESAGVTLEERRDSLGVMSQEVVVIERESADRRKLVEAGVGSMPVVLVIPDGQRSGSFL